MKSNVTFFLILAALAVAFGWSTGCRDDVVVPYPPSVVGNYTGIYSYLEINGIDTPVDTFQFITLLFTSSTYNMKLDEKLQSEQTRHFCDVKGDYSLEGGIFFDETNPNLGPDLCTVGENPKGFFGLNQNTGTDTIIIKQDLTDEEGVRMIKTLKLKLKR